MKARPKKYILLRINTFSGIAKCFVHCFPQQKWTVILNEKTAELNYKHVDLVIPRTDFDRDWLIIDIKI